MMVMTDPCFQTLCPSAKYIRCEKTKDIPLDKCVIKMLTLPYFEVNILIYH